MTSNDKLLIEREVDRLFAEMHAVHGHVCQNPITDASFVGGVDPIGSQKSDAIQALLAREWFADNGPADAAPLPLSHDDIEDARNARGLTRVVGFYARSRAFRDWDPEHPSFDNYVRGLMASDTGCWRIAENAELHFRFPPRRLVGMGPDLRWRPPAVHARYMESLNRAEARLAA